MELALGEAEVLAAARLLLGPGISLCPRPRVAYVHLMFERHQVIFADGLASESFFPGEQALGVEAAQRAEILAIFPELARTQQARGPMARPAIRAFEAAHLVAETRAAAFGPFAARL